MKRIVVLGGAFFALGNVNPAAEANVSANVHLSLILTIELVVILV